jgi:hypothetical protein
MDTIYHIAQNTGFLGGEISSTTSISLSSTTAEISSILAANTFVRVVATQNCHINFGTYGSTSAATSNTYLTANTVEVFYTGSSTSIAAIRNSADGILYIDVLTFPDVA